ncbi:MAG: hypothetical protein ACRD0S_10255, partial [Acidimicrobiales bacterium]
LPFFVTGGASPESLPGLLAAGADRFVVVRALTEAADPVKVTRQLRELMDHGPEGITATGGPASR